VIYIGRILGRESERIGIGASGDRLTGSGSLKV